MATDLGKVGIVMKGTWSNSATYEVLDVVSYNGGLYIAKQAVPANTVPTNTTYWQVAVNYSIENYTGFTKSDGSIVSTNSPMKIYKWGKVVFLSFSGQTSAAPSGSYGAMYENLPHPKEDVRAMFFTSGATPQFLPVQITSAGVMRTATNAGTSAGWYLCTLTYLEE